MAKVPEDYDLIASVEKYLGITGIGQLTCEEVLALMDAKEQDRVRRRTELYRERKLRSAYDLKLFCRVAEGIVRQYGADPETLTMPEAMEFIRLKRRRRGHVQQEALEIWDTYYANGEFRNPTDEEIDEIESILDGEDAR